MSTEEREPTPEELALAKALCTWQMACAAALAAGVHADVVTPGLLAGIDVVRKNVNEPRYILGLADSMWPGAARIVTGEPLDNPSIEEVKAWAVYLGKRVSAVSTLLYERVSPYYELNGGTVGIFSPASSSFSSRGDVFAEFPLAYLAMSDEEVRAAETASEDKEAREEAARVHALRLRTAGTRLLEAQARVETARSDAEAELREAEQEFKALQRSAPQEPTE